MDAVAASPPFEPVGGRPSGVFLHVDADAPHSTRAEHCLGAGVTMPELALDEDLYVCLHTNDAAEGPVERFAAAEFEELARAPNDVLDARIRGAEALRAANTRSAFETDAFQTKVFLTAHLLNGLKVGIWAPFRPFLYALVPGDDRRGFETVVAPQLRDAFRALTIEYQHRPKFHGYVPASRQEPTRRREFLWARIACPSTAVMRKVVRALRLEDTSRAWAWKAPHEVWEDGIDTPQKFLDAHGLEPSGWHVLRAGSFSLTRKRALLVDIELQVGDARALKRAADLTRVPALSLVVLDGEMNSHTESRFPKPNRANNQVVVVSGVFAYAGTLPPALAAAGHKEYVEYERRAWVLGRTCAPIPGVIVECFDDEWSLLAAVRDELFVHKRVDIVSGHNVIRFDLPYMYRRAALFGNETGKRFLRFGVLNAEASLSRALAPREGYGGAPAYKSTKILCPGVALLDTMLVCKSEKKLTQNTLAAACEAFLRTGAAKFDMPYELIPAVCAGTNAAHWATFVAYCVQDSVLVLRLLQKWDKPKDLVAQSRIMNVPMAINTQCGQQERVRDYLMKDAHAAPVPYVMNGVNDTRRPRPVPPHVPATGGWVLANKQGYYKLPVVVLDFASLYPSCMAAYNLCYSTLVADPAFIGFPGLDTETFETDTGTFTFVRSPEGVTPAALRKKKAERAAYKREMATHAYGSAEYAVCNNAQNAIKIPMNSVYGAANADAEKGVAPCSALGTSTTFLGRRMNGLSADFLVKTYGVHLLYGDTDSVFVYFPEPPELVASGTWLERLHYAMARGAEAAAALNAFISATMHTTEVRVEFEKVYFPWISARKKTYAGLKFEPGDEKGANDDLTVGGRVECKGVRVVRRDVPAFVRRIKQPLFHALFITRDLDEFWACVHDTTVALCTPGALPLADYIITAELKPGYAAQASVTAQTAVSYAREYAQRGTAFSAGDRVPYVIVDESDSQRLKRPPWMDVELLNEDLPWSDEDSDDEEPTGGAGSAASRSNYVCVSTLKASRARHPDEVLRAPHANHLDVIHYVKALCAVCEQLMPQETDAIAELLRYAEAAKQFNAFQDALARGVDHGFRLQAVPKPPALSRKKPLPKPVMVLTTLSGAPFAPPAAPKQAPPSKKRPLPANTKVQQMKL